MLPSPVLHDEEGALSAEEAVAYFRDLGAESEDPGDRATSTGARDADAEDRCQAPKGDGERCKNRAIGGTRYCRVHEKLVESDGLCKAILGSGKPCRNSALESSDYCGVHRRLAD